MITQQLPIVLCLTAVWTFHESCEKVTISCYVESDYGLFIDIQYESYISFNLMFASIILQILVTIQ